MKLPKCLFDEESYNFNKTSFAQEIKLPPLDHVSKNKDIPYEEIKTNQYRNAAKMYSFKTDGNRLFQEEQAVSETRKETINKLELELNQVTNTISKCKTVKPTPEKDKSQSVVSDNVKVNVSTHNRFSALEDQNTEETRNIVNHKLLDALIITDSHGRDLDPSKLYRYRKVNVQVLPRGKKTIQGAHEYIEQTDIQAKNILVMVGSNDLSHNKSPDILAEHLSTLKNLVNNRFPNTNIHVFPLFHRLNEELFNQDVDIVNTRLERLISNSLSLVRNDNINVRNHRYCLTDGLHLSISGNFELVRAIKSHMNPVLGLKDYHNYNQSENIHQLTTPRKNHLPPQHTMPNRLFFAS
ncbi:unnamed protein product [Mytilus edulis]|uniref:Uncharacterized protein n=1 Tax=Mytilus edulis TaxID=6550 RepID=A0A8S3SQD1_MYTED|nr:unnamed protein product [Mytilus edulis]